MTETNEKLDILPGQPDAAPLLPEEKKGAEEIPLSEPKQEEAGEHQKFPDLLAKQDFASEPEFGPYRWIILVSYVVAVIATSSISSYFNYLEVLLVDVSVGLDLDRCLQ